MEDKRITTETTEDKYGDAVITVYVDGNEHFQWNDCAHTDYPEDLSWGRLISEVFNAGVEAGKLVSAPSDDLVVDKDLVDELIEAVDQFNLSSSRRSGRLERRQRVNAAITSIRGE